MKFQNVKGTRDFYPEDMALSNWIVQTWRQVAERNGFVEYDGPTFEYLDLYKAKSGEGIVSELFHFEDRGGRQLALRPEMTPTLARMVAARAPSLPRPIKWYCVPRFFRAERPQRGRLREFLQWNVDILGTPPGADPVADAECIFVAVDFLREAGFGAGDVRVHISSRELLGGILRTLGFAAERHGELYALLDRRDKLPPEVFQAELAKAATAPGQFEGLMQLAGATGPGGLAEVAERVQDDDAARTAAAELSEVFDLLQLMGVADYCSFDLGVVRGLAYYTGTVFEAYSTGTLKRAVCGGGRYGRLLEAVGGPPLSGVGFGMGDVIVLDQLAEIGRLPQPVPRVDFWVVHAGEGYFRRALQIVGLVRSQVRRACNFSYAGQALKKQMQQAGQHAARYVIVVGEVSATGDVLEIKDMASGRQRQYTFEEFHQRHEQIRQAVSDPLAADFTE